MTTEQERDKFGEWVRTLPKPVQENVLSSMKRGESYTFDAWQAALNSVALQASGAKQ